MSGRIRKFVKTVTDLAAECDLSRDKMHGWINRTGAPEKTKVGWNVQKVQEFMRDTKRKGRERVDGVNADLKRTKLEREITVLDEKIAGLRRENIPMKEHVAELREYAAMVNSVFDRWIQEVANVTRSAKLVKAAKVLRTQARGQLAEAVK